MTDSRINMRISKENHETLKDAASSVGQDLTSFILEAAMERAELVMSKRNIFKLSPEEIKTLERVLAEEPKFNQKLHDLLNQGQSWRSRIEPESES